MTKRAPLMTALLLLAMGAGLPTLAGRATPKAPTWSDYQVIVERNVFLKTLPTPTAGGPTVATITQNLPDFGQAAAPVIAPVVLTGVILRGSEYLAFLEDTGTETTLRLRQGDSYGEGRITAVERDAILYRRGRTSTRVEVGHALDGSLYVPATRTGGAASGQTTDGAAAETAPAATGGAAAAGDESDDAATLERLRQRREKESNQ
jgi:hypothetical protein